MKVVVQDTGRSALLDSLAPMLWHLPAGEQRGFTKRVSPAESPVRDMYGYNRGAAASASEGIL